ncbi:MAG: photosystem II reaction center protein Ycf12 [Leptolyngbyaceae cyanobacterium bins.59]|nr:photosystem II reaction center protein Ycf12 [Leptolyngbyaceae cyanobacterium bins.59]
MDFITGIFSGITSFNWEPIFQLTLVALIMISGPVVIVLLAARGGDL